MQLDYEYTQEHQSKVKSASKDSGDWQIDSNITYLDHGAFGGCPIPVSDAQKSIKFEIEHNPHNFYERNYTSSWEHSRRSLSTFINADLSGLVILPGATHALNVVIHSQELSAGDEILTTNHAYSSTILALQATVKHPDQLKIVDIPLQNTKQEDILEAILLGVTSRTRLAIIEHVASRSGLIFPVKLIVEALSKCGVDTLVDGAHAPGMIKLDVDYIGAAYYAANCHKWMCSPRGTGFLHIRKDKISKIKPLVIARSPFAINKSQYSSLQHSFTWMGTLDPSAALCIPTAIEFLENAMPGGYQGLIKRNHALAVVARKIICKILDIPIPCPDSMIGNMATIPLPDSPSKEQEGILPIQDKLWHDYQIIVPCYSWPKYPKRVMRISVQAYNTIEQYVKLAHCIKVLLLEERVSLKKQHQVYQKTKAEINDPSGNQLALKPKNLVQYLNSCFSDIKSPTIYDMMQIAQHRIWRLSAMNSIPAVKWLYPTASQAEAQCTLRNRITAFDTNSEISRVSHMVAHVKERRIPKVLVPIITDLLKNNGIIENWSSVIGELKAYTQTIIDKVLHKMAPEPVPSILTTQKRAFQNFVIAYDTDEGETSQSLWLTVLKKSVEDVDSWHHSEAEIFLRIYAFLKDPIGGLRKDLALQTKFFITILESLKYEFHRSQLSSDIWQAIVAQTALESAHLANPLVQTATHIHFVGDQQLTYSYVELDALQRSEFACSAIVIQMIRELILANEEELHIAPITVTSGYKINKNFEPCIIVIDGNNRLTMIFLLKYMAYFGVPENAEDNRMYDYFQNKGLDPLSYVDASTVLSELVAHHKDLLRQLGGSKILYTIRDQTKVPVLIGEETAFLTKYYTNGGESVLQPVQQSVFADPSLMIAFPGKIQEHGRSQGYLPLPLI